MKLNKVVIYLCLTIQASSLIAQSNDDYKIVIEPMWRNLDNNCDQTTTTFCSTWVLAGSITFEKKPKEPVSLHRLHVQWLGTHLKNLTASLYRKTPDKDFYPIEANLICDGIWCEKKQTVIFTFNEEKNLGPRNIFYLVLTIPHDLEDIIKQGSFSLLSHTLPEPFRPSIQDDRLCLSLDAIGSVTTHVCKK